MKTANRSNALLVELLIVIMFFMLSSTVLIRVFFTSHQLSERAGVRSEALNDAQNVADRLLCADSEYEAIKLLAAEGFNVQCEVYTLERGGYTLRVSIGTDERLSGIMLSGYVEACQEDEALLTLPIAKYVEVTP